MKLPEAMRERAGGRARFENLVISSFGMSRCLFVGMRVWVRVGCICRITSNQIQFAFTVFMCVQCTSFQPQPKWCSKQFICVSKCIQTVYRCVFILPIKFTLFCFYSLSVCASISFALQFVSFHRLIVLSPFLSPCHRFELEGKRHKCSFS